MAKAADIAVAVNTPAGAIPLNREKGIVYVLHADIPEEANSVKTAIEAQTSTKNVILTEMGPVIGSHVGPGTLAVIFSGTER